MKPHSRAPEQDDLLRPRLVDMIDPRHELVKLTARRCCRSQRLSDQPLSPFGSGNAFNLGSAECVEAVYQRHTDVDFGCLAIRIT